MAHTFGFSFEQLAARWRRRRYRPHGRIRSSMRRTMRRQMEGKVAGRADSYISLMEDQSAQKTQAVTDVTRGHITVFGTVTFTVLSRKNGRDSP